ncbi:M1 family metallopeptidase [Balneolaceae bacterium YR4-1]|uniref:M1 family metallopeptidase n=1 Tax=Halalkalibaculum roseum TaxID=2709311 RepID=A0A6M1SRZ4_9BACT|nr:M1 family metallopeptidase [Halalkalibaculum roseum]NGP75590.1 M1 family metallopeptidase [Halalkalibaculum roseum]
MKLRFNPLFSATAILGLILIAGCATTKTGSDPAPKDNTGNTVKTNEQASPFEIDRPVPNDIDEEIPNAFYQAYSNGTRTFSGKPGSEYWQQYASYDMDVTLNPDNKTVTGNSTITYYNNSPDTLGQLFLELSQNVHKEGVVRNESAEVTGGINLKNMVYEGDTLQVIRRYGDRGYYVDGTVMTILPDQPLAPGDSVTMNIDWNFKVPQEGAGGRMGYSEKNLFYIAYWYPQMRVYDDVNGWFTDPFRINAEFYHGFADYDVRITAPDQWVVTSTGQLQNGKEVLVSSVYDRMMKAYSGDEVVNVVSSSDFGNITRTDGDNTATWHFTAENIRDFVFSVTKESIWDATRAPIGDLNDDGNTDYTEINALYRSSAPLWKNAAKFARHSTSFLSEYTGIDYPWPHMTAVEGGGIIGGGMEFPMMTIIGAYRGRAAQSLYAVIAHEIAHMWVPMMISTNERHYSWMDEGTTTFNENLAKLDYYPDGPDFEIADFQSYLQIAGTDYEGEIMRWSDFHYNGLAYSRASYSKPASMLVTLRGLLGEDVFEEAYQTFLKEWEYKHPYPWDLFNTFEDVSGRDLDWFWRSWYYETWTLDHAVTDVTQSENGTRIIIQDLGLSPMPAEVQITLQDGSVINKKIDVDTWLSGATAAILVIDNTSPVQKVEIDPDYLFPDVNRDNNIWEQ